MKPLLISAALAVAASGAQAQAVDVEHDTIGILCYETGECQELTHPSRSPSIEVCTAQRAQRFILLMLHIQQTPALGEGLATVNVECRPSGAAA